MKLLALVVFLILLGFDFYTGSHLLHVVGWVFRLPNHDYLFVLCILPLLVSVVAHLFKHQDQVGFVNSAFSAVLIVGGPSYVLAGGAQLWRLPVIPIGLVTVAMGIALIRQGLALTTGKSYKTNKHRMVFALGVCGFIVASTIYLQPWSIVFDMPNVEGKNHENIDLSNTYLNLVSFDEVNLEGADFTGASLVGVDFVNVKLNGVSFRDADIENTIFRESSLVGADFSDARIYQSKFIDSDLRNSILTPSFVGRTYINTSLLCGAMLGDLQTGVYGWQGSTIDEAALRTLEGESDSIRKFQDLQYCGSENNRE